MAHAKNICRALRRVLPVLFLAVAAFLSANAAPAQNLPKLKLLSLRLAEAEPALRGEKPQFRIIAVFDRKADFSLLILGKPPRLALNLPAAEFAFSAAAIEKSGKIAGLRYGFAGAGRSRIIFSFTEPFQIKDITETMLEPEKAASAWQLTLTLETISAAEFQRSSAMAARDAGSLNLRGAADLAAEAARRGDDSRPFRVMIDAGHGDFDSGAIGAAGTQEKQAALAFSLKLYQILRDKTGIEPYLTRNGDEFLRLGARVDKARAENADLFISVHADHIAMPGLHGATVYTLADKASDDMAKLLAEYQNKADMLDGLPADEPPAVADILLDMTRRETRLFSEDFARMLISALRGGGIGLINNPHRAAGFQVLRAADIPSVLIELGYLSNPADEKRIMNPLWQEKMAGILAQTIVSYAQSHAKSKMRR